MEHKLYLALPILNESVVITNLLNCLSLQDFSTFTIVACVNQYDSWWDDAYKIKLCHDNAASIKLLSNRNDLDINIIDKSTKGNGWQTKKGGVGWARKTIMDYIASVANDDDIIVSIDADTYYPTNYLSSIHDFFISYKNTVGLALPYYHKLNCDVTDRLILRYEIYMRYYLLNMMRIENPYAYTALGSAMAFPVWAYRKAGGLTPVAAGEDFYFLQKLVKIGTIGVWSSTIAYPSPRFSNRVIFGTGPALIKGHSGNWSSYPHYHYTLFDKIKDTYNTFDELYYGDVITPMDEFLNDKKKVESIWLPLRKNYKDKKNFIRACINKVDGLRILQFLRKQQAQIATSDEEIIYNYLAYYFTDDVDRTLLGDIANFSFEDSPIELLSRLRDFLFVTEMKTRKDRMLNTNI